MSAADSKSDHGQSRMGNALAEAGDLSEAIATYLEAIRRGEHAGPGGKDAPHTYLGTARRLTGDSAGTIAMYREAVRLEPDRSNEARYGLGLTLAETGEVPGAIAALQQAIQHDYLKQPGPFRLLRVILMARQPDKAIAALRPVRENGHDDETIVRAIDQAIRQFEQLSRLAADDSEGISTLESGPNELPEHYYRRRFFAASAAICSAGFTADPKLAEDISAQNRYNAACSAASAAAGDWDRQASPRRGGENPLASSGTHVAQGRFDLLVNTHRGRRAQSKGRSNRDAQAVEIRPRPCGRPRQEAELAKLPEPEQKAWQAFWAEVAAECSKKLRRR